jgi:hypothetical protein
MIVCMGGKLKRKRFLGGFGPPGSRTKRIPKIGGLVLEARAGGFIPIGNDDRSHRGAALLSDGLRKRGAVEAALMGE